MGIDMSNAFSTIIRSTIINLLHDSGCSEDDIRLVKMLLRNTNLRVKLKNILSDPFSITLGSFQGDSISAKLFTLYLAGALNHLRTVSAIPNPPIFSSLMPSESQYADVVQINFVVQDSFKQSNVIQSNVVQINFVAQESFKQSNVFQAK